MDEYDVYLNAVGYMLAKDEQGHLLAGAISTQESDPFTRHIAEEERWKIANFRFSEGAGALKHDGTKRYAFGENVDTRSGDWMRGPEVTRTAKRALDHDFNQREGDLGAVTVVEVSNAGGDHDGYGFQFTASAAHTEVRSVGLLVKRRSDVNYDAAGTFDVEIRADTGGGVPAAAAVAGGQASMSPVFTEHAWLPHENLWIGNEYFWLEVTFSGIVTIVATNPYWLCLMNAQAFPIDWAATVSGGPTGTVASWNGAAWTASTDQKPHCVVQYADDIDAFTRAFATFAGSDNIRRLYAAVGAKVMYWDDATSAWLASKDDFPQVVHDLAVYEGDLFAAIGDGSIFWWFDGSSPTATWTAISVPGNQEAQCVALHDNLLWKVDVATCRGTLIAHGAGSWSAGATFEIGDPQIPVSKMKSHGGKLFCAKPEGIFEVTYPDTYPASGTPIANMIHDFTSDRYGRNFILDWHSGCYFPAPGGVFEWKSGVLQDVWRQRFKQDADGTPLLPTYTDRKGEFRGVGGSTRGVAFGSYNAYCGDDGINDPGGSHIQWFDGRYFHSLYSSVFVGEPIRAVFMESRGEGWSRLWWGQGFDILYADWPTWTDDRSADDRCTFFDQSSASKDEPTIWTSWVDDDKPELLKDWHEVRIHGKNIGDGATEGGELKVYYYNDDGARTLLGTVTGTSGTDHILAFPANSTGYRLQLEITATSPVSQAYTFRVYAMELLYQPLYDTITQYHLTIRIGDGLELRSGTEDQRSGATQAEALSALLDEAEPFTYKDELGNSQCVRVVGATRQAGKLERRPSGRGGGLQVSGTVQMSLLKVADTCPS